MKPTWESLAPVLRGACIQSETTWVVIESHTPFIVGNVRHVVRGAADMASRHGSVADAARLAFQWVVERLFRRVGNPPPGLPVNERTDGSRGDASRWFATVVRNLTRDWLKAERRQIKRETAIPEYAPPAVVDEPTLWDDDNLRKLTRLLQRPERADVPETQVLAYLCLYRPEAVDRPMVERAAAYRPSAGSRSGMPGLYRPVEETWQALLAWRQRHELEPRSRHARVELAWILRSEDAGDVTTWRSRDKAGARRATVTVGKWAIRCADALFLPRS